MQRRVAGLCSARFEGPAEVVCGERLAGVAGTGGCRWLSWHGRHRGCESGGRLRAGVRCLHRAHGEVSAFEDVDDERGFGLAVKSEQIGFVERSLMVEFGEGVQLGNVRPRGKPLVGQITRIEPRSGTETQ